MTGSVQGPLATFILQAVQVKRQHLAACPVKETRDQPSGQPSSDLSL